MRVRIRRSPDRTAPGDQLAGHVRYGLLVSRDGGNSSPCSPAAGRARSARSSGSAAKAANVLVTTACDANGNCGLKRLGRFRPCGA